MRCIVGLILVSCSLTFSVGEFVECDLDLDDPTGTILAQLPIECHNLDEPSKVLLLQEAESFKRFHRKLLDYEAGQGRDTEEEIYMDMDFRRELYEAAVLHECLDIEEEKKERTLEEYVQCLVEKRDAMVSFIESKTLQA